MKVTFQGNPLTLEGTQVKVGDNAPNFTVVNNDLNEVSLNDTKGKRIFLTVPSLDTPVCDTEVRRFNEEASKLNNVYFGDRFYVKDGRIFELNGQYEYMIDCGVVLDMRDRSVKDISGRYRNVVFIENEIK